MSLKRTFMKGFNGKYFTIVILVAISTHAVATKNPHLWCGKLLEGQLDIQSRIRQIGFLRGANEHTGAYHGTSLAALLYAVEHGNLPSNDHHTEPESGKKGIYVEPIRSRFSRKFKHVYKSNLFVDSPSLAFNRTVGYAMDNARASAFLSEMEIPYSMDNSFYARVLVGETVARRLTDLESVASELKRFVPDWKSKFDNAMSVAERSKGVVIGVDKKAFSQFRSSRGDEGLFLELPAGLPFGFVTEIHPMGEAEERTLETLRGSRL